MSHCYTLRFNAFGHFLLAHASQTVTVEEAVGILRYLDAQYLTEALKYVHLLPCANIHVCAPAGVYVCACECIYVCTCECTYVLVSVSVY